MVDRSVVGFLLSRGGDIAAAGRYVDCGTPGLGWVGSCSSDPSHSEVYHPFSCMLRICPVCSARRAAQLASEIETPIAALLNASPPGYYLKHIVLTTSVDLSFDDDELRDIVKSYRIGVREIFQALFPKDKKLGGLVGAEFGEQGRKLHFHVLLLSRYIDKADLEQRWEALTDGRGRWSFIRKIDSVSDGIAEICKYVTKPTSSKDDDVEEVLAKLHFVLKGIRRLQAFGSFFNMDREVNECSAVCPDCGAALFWIPEIEWSKIQENVALFSPEAPLYLKTANKSPPSGYKQLGFEAVNRGFYPPAPLS